MTNAVLNLVLYVDETVSGNPLNPCNSKKSHLIYISILELGLRLSQAEFWMVAGVVTTAKAAEVTGGLSEILKKILLHWLQSADGILHPAGFSLLLRGQHELVRFKLHAMIADEAALRGVLLAKGASGLKPCSKCYNIISKWHGREYQLDESDSVKDISESNHSAFMEYIDTDIFRIVERLRVAHAEQPWSEVKKQEMIYGFSFCDSALLADATARSVLPPSKCLYDFLHCLFSNGIVCLEVCEFWKAVRQRTQLDLNDLQQFCTGCGFHLRKSIHDCRLQRVFDSKYIEKPTYGGDASHCVLALFLLEIFISYVLPDHEELRPHIFSLKKLCVLCRWYFRLKAGKCRPNMLPSRWMIKLISEHLQAFTAAWGKGMVRPKHHFNFHCAESMDLQAQTLDCWTMERKHRVYKNSAKNFAYSGSFEPAILTKLLMIQEEQLRDIMPEPYLQSPTSDPSLASRCQCTSAEVGQTLRYQSQSYHAGDMCLFDDDPGKAIKILQCCSLLLPGSNSWSFYLLGEDLQRATDIRASDDQWHFSQWRSIGSQSLIPMSSRASRIMIPLLWWQSGEIVTVSCWHLSSRILAVWKTNSGLVDALFEINLSKLFLEQMQDD